MLSSRRVPSGIKKIITHNEEETFCLGQELGRTCRGGEVFALYGDLGAGKTKFVQGLAVGLGVKSRVNSPTFNILKIYKTETSAPVKTFCHIDAYRLKDAAGLAALGAEEFFDDRTTVSAVEWAEKVEGVLPRSVKTITIEHLAGTDRKITIK